MSETQIRFWHRHFSQEGIGASTADRPRPGHPRSSRTASSISKVQGILQEDCRCSVREVASECSISETVAFQILRKDLNVRKRAARLVPTFLTESQKEVHAQLCDENLTTWKRDTEHFLSRIVTCDKTWISTFEAETKRQSSVWIQPGDS